MHDIFGGQLTVVLRAFSTFNCSNWVIYRQLSSFYDYLLITIHLIRFRQGIGSIYHRHIYYCAQSYSIPQILSCLLILAEQKHQTAPKYLTCLLILLCFINIGQNRCEELATPKVRRKINSTAQRVSYSTML